MAEEDEALLEAEAQLPGGDDEIHWSDIETDSSEDDEYFPPAPATHDHEARDLESQLSQQSLLSPSLR